MVDGCKWNNFPCKLSRKKKTCLRNYARKAALGLKQNSQTGYHPSNIPAFNHFSEAAFRLWCNAFLRMW